MPPACSEAADAEGAVSARARVLGAPMVGGATAAESPTATAAEREAANARWRLREERGTRGAFLSRRRHEPAQHSLGSHLSQHLRVMTFLPEWSLRQIVTS